MEDARSVDRCPFSVSDNLGMVLSSAILMGFADSKKMAET
jgi:hypothetical protein